MGEPTAVSLRPHHGGKSWSTDWYGPDRDDKGRLRRHYKRFGPAASMGARVAKGIFVRWRDSEWKPRYGKGADSQLFKSTVAELAKDYFAYLQTYHVKNGKITSQISIAKKALEILAAKYGALDVNEMTAPRMAQLRDELLKPNQKNRKTPLAVGTAMKYLTTIKRAFRWMRQEKGIVTAVVAADVMLVTPLKKGRCVSTERPAVQPVEWERVEKTLAFLPDNMKAMVLIQWHTGMRPGEVRSIRPCDIKVSGEDWTYSPVGHKTEHKGKIRKVAIGPQAQKILQPYLARQTTAFCFIPAEAKKQGFRTLGGKIKFRQVQYGNLIKNAARKAKVAHWQPNMLRHSWATRVAEEFGIEAAADGLGHASLNTALIYAEKSLKRASEVARKVG